MKKKLIAVVLSVMFMCGAVSIAPKASSKLYPTSTIVTAIDGNKITVTDFNGVDYTFINAGNNADDWFIGDICACIMSDNGTDIVYDDTIVQAQYAGYIQ